MKRIVIVHCSFDHLTTKQKTKKQKTKPSLSCMTPHTVAACCIYLYAATYTVFRALAMFFVDEITSWLLFAAAWK